MMDIRKADIFSAVVYQEEDGSVTLSLNEIDLVENGSDINDAKRKLGVSICEYAFDYLSDYRFYSHSANRQAHIPYVVKALLADNPQEIGEGIICRNGEEKMSA